MQVKVGDRVFFYFLHALSDVPNPDSDGKQNLWTGRCEIRCRPALVTHVHPVMALNILGQDISGPPNRVDLLVSFDQADREISEGGRGFDHAGGFVFPPKPVRNGVCAALIVRRDQPPRIGEVVGSEWPMPNTWAFTSKMAN